VRLGWVTSQKVMTMRLIVRKVVGCWITPRCYRSLRAEEGRARFTAGGSRRDPHLNAPLNAPLRRADIESAFVAGIRATRVATSTSLSLALSTNFSSPQKADTPRGHATAGVFGVVPVGRPRIQAGSISLMTSVPSCTGSHTAQHGTHRSR
jgi:hypothetical protein